MLALLRVSSRHGCRIYVNHFVPQQNELMQRHQNEQQNELVRYLHDLNGWLARDVNNRQAELQGVEGRIAHLQNALAGRAPVPCSY
jgi:hypothetical protein